MPTRFLRPISASVLAATAGMMLLPYITSNVSSSAVVNAQVHSIKAPFDARVLVSSPDTADPVLAEQVVLELAAVRESRGEVEALRADRETVSARSASIEAQIDELQDLHADLAERLDLLKAESRKWIDARLKEIRAATGEDAVRREYLVREIDRAERLQDSGVVTKVSLEQKRVALHALEKEIAQQNAREEAQITAADALQKGVIVDGQFSSSDYIRQRLDEVQIRLADLTSQKAVLDARGKALDRQISVAQGEANDREVFRLPAGTTGVVWQSSPGAGVTVNAGDEILQLLDCQHRFLEVAISERLFDQIRPGDPATVKLKGSSKEFTATVEAVRGSGASFARPLLAADPKKAEGDELSVIVGLAPADVADPRVAASFCDVGRSAEVRFDRDNGIAQVIADAKDALGWHLSTRRHADAGTGTRAVVQ